MANYVPLLEGTDAGGGYLVPDGQNGLVFERRLARVSAVSGMPGLRIQRVNGKREKYVDYVGTPTVATVAEAADKPVTGAELAQVTLDIVKAAGSVLLTEEVVEDADGQLISRIDRDIRLAFGAWVDQNALGRNAAGAIVSSFNSELSETTQTVELGTSGDAFAVAVSSALGTIEANGYNATGIIAANDVGVHLRGARSAGDATAPLYTDGFSAEPDSIYGRPIRKTTNLQSFSAAAAAGRVVGIVGDFTQALLGIRNDVRRKVSDQATVNVGGADHRLWQRNEMGVLWEMRAGFVAHDLNRAFVAIINAA